MVAPAQLIPHGMDDLDRVCREHFDYVWRCLRHLGVAEDELGDAAQDVFVSVIKCADRFEGRASIRTWLFAFVRNTVMTRRRHATRLEKKHTMFALACDGVSRPDPMSVHDDERHALHVLQLLLGQLDGDKRGLYVLVELEGVSIVEISKETGANVNTLYTRLRAARKQMKAAAKRYLADERDRG